MNIYFLVMIFSMNIYIVLEIVINKKIGSANNFFVAGRQLPTLFIFDSLVA